MSDELNEIRWQRDTCRTELTKERAARLHAEMLLRYAEEAIMAEYRLRIGDSHHGEVIK